MAGAKTPVLVLVASDTALVLSLVAGDTAPVPSLAVGDIAPVLSLVAGDTTSVTVDPSTYEFALSDTVVLSTVESNFLSQDKSEAFFTQSSDLILN